MKNLFIDTNIYLTFYHFSSDDLEELKKLSVAVDNNKIKLYITDQVMNEFRRNREAKIADALKIFTDQKLPDQFPQMCKVYDEYHELRDLLKEWWKIREQLLDKLRRDIDSNQCGADKIIESLFDVAENLEIDEDIMEKAKNRVALGNPPGKENSYGDSINWELLLQKVPSGQDLHLVTGDQDYSSKIARSKLSEFLNHEWERAKESKIFYYTKLSDFLRNEFPDIELASELEKELAIRDLVSSPNFSSTHKAIRKLSKFADFSDAEVIELIEASIDNDQIYWISDDSDVRLFLFRIIEGKEDILEPELLDRFNEIYRAESEENSNEDDELL
jgi:hypothetical protein